MPKCAALVERPDPVARQIADVHKINRREHVCDAWELGGSRGIQRQDSCVWKRRTHALIGLAREKPYRSIAVKEILDRANVGRSTFYTHFRDKDDLLETDIHEILGSLQDEPRVGRPLERLLAFSLPLVRHVDEHRRAAGPRMKREGRVIMHEHLKGVLTPLITDELATALAGKPGPLTPTDLVARHVASTFVLVLNWWVDGDSALTPAEVDACFRALVVPTLTKLSIEVG